MPRVHSQKAAKDYPDQGIQKGDTYYKWKFRYGPVIRSKTFPKQSQLTQSEFLGQVYDLQDRINELSAESIHEELEGLVGEIRELGEEQEAKQQNMPESLQYSPTGELLGERYEMCEDWATSLEGIELPDEMSEEDRPEDVSGDEPDEPQRDQFDEGDDGDAEFKDAHEEWQDEYSTWEEQVSEYDDFESKWAEYESEIDAAVEEAQGFQYEGS